MNKSKFIISLTEDQLELLSDICHSYKDYHRGIAEAVVPVMELESSLHTQTAGKYEPDTTYNI